MSGGLTTYDAKEKPSGLHDPKTIKRATSARTAVINTLPAVDPDLDIRGLVEVTPIIAENEILVHQYTEEVVELTGEVTSKDSPWENSENKPKKLS